MNEMNPARAAALSTTAPSHLTFPVVGIGASAGGLNALSRFFENMPSDSGMAFVVVLHLSAEHESNVADILQRVTRMTVSQVAGSVRIAANEVYVIPPGRDLRMQDGTLETSESSRPRGRHVAIDLFLRTLAEAHRERAVSIILSGTGSDGAVGISRIKEQGGMTFAQEPGDAEYDGMPGAAIGTGMVDHVLPATELPQKLLELAANAATIELPQPGPQLQPVQPPRDGEGGRAAEVALAAIMQMLRERTGHDFTHYKRATVLRRLERRLQVSGLPNLPDYCRFLENNEAETAPLLQDMLIGVTNFFRDRASFEALERDIVPQLSSAAGADAGSQLRAWVAGCATGEEAYSVAMLLTEAASELPQRRDIQVFATDIDERAIAIGRRGLYPLSIVTDVAPTRLRQFFTKENNRYQVKKSLRESVLFAAHNILRDPPFSHVQLICCRNLLIYLNRDVQQKILEMFHFALAPGGYLFLGSSESAEVAERYFAPVDKRHRIYRAIGVPQHTGYVSAAPAAPVRAGGRATLPREQKQAGASGDLHQRMLEKYAPPSVLVNRDGDIVHVSDTAGRYLHLAGGEPSHNLLALIAPELRLELRSSLFQSMQGGGVDARGVRMRVDGREVTVKLSVHPAHGDDAQADLVLVLFHEVDGSRDEAADAARDEPTALAVMQLEGELKHTKEQLQNTIEQYETSAEELKASNEELQAINEELRSTTEELETSKEELQSINEELVTVNSELKDKVDETAKANDDMQNFVAAAGIATIFVDRALHVKRYTPRAAEIFNLIGSDIGRPLLDITHRLDYDRLESDAAEVFVTLHMIEREVGSHAGRWYIARLLPYRTLEDRIDGLVLSFIDVTSLHRAESSVQEGERRMRLVAASTRDYAIITFDLAGSISSWNGGAQRIFGWSAEEALGQSIDIIFTPEDRECQLPQTEMLAARRDGRAEDERWHVRKDGTRFFCSGVTTLLDDGETRGFAKIARDLTGNKHAETRRDAVLAHETEVRKAAEQAIRMREEFLAVLSHELKQPLNLIHLNAELLKRIPDSRESEPIMRIADTIRSTAIGQAQIIDDLLDLSRVRTGKLTLTRGAVNLTRTVQRIAEAFRNDAAAKRIDLSLQPGPADVMLNADATRVEQIVWNLLSNAIKFTPDRGSVSVAIACEDRMACLRVRDTGKGIEPRFLPHVFEMFFQADSGSTREHGGLGIGLALVRQLAESHGGRAEVFSEGLGRGTEFRVWLPLGEGREGHKDHETPRDAAPAGEWPVLKGLHILLVDDEPDNLFSFGELLRLHGALVCPAVGAAEALLHLDDQLFDLVVSDIAMPGIDGYDLLAAIRKLPHGAALPMIAVTGFGRINDVERTLKAGFAAHLKKPIALDTFARTVAALIPENSGRVGATHA